MLKWINANQFVRPHLRTTPHPTQTAAACATVIAVPLEVSKRSSAADTTGRTHSGDEGEHGSKAQIATILLVDNDPGTLEEFRRALEEVRSTVLVSTTGQSAIRLVRHHPIDLIIIDLNLPDISGIEMIRRGRDEGNPRPFIVVSALLTIPISVQAMRLGAFDVIEKPVTIARLVAVVQACLRNSASENRTPSEDPIAIHIPRLNGCAGSAAQRWEMYVVKGCEAASDLRTLQDWARYAGVSYSTLCESCRLIGIQPQAARDFTRTLRAMISSSANHCDPCVLLDVSDRRTLKVLLARAGPFFRSGETNPVIQFIRHQQFVPTSNEGIRMLLGHFGNLSASPIG